MIDISKDNLEIVLSILKKFVPNSEIRVFGSRYNGTSKKYSDLDIAIVSDKELDWELIS
ncbi:MAG: nucleotidyltransferase domain-containing protein, partial [Candidatus Sericytochromatia bacterium]